jgi:colicin import membrane protein
VIKVDADANNKVKEDAGAKLLEAVQARILGEKAAAAAAALKQQAEEEQRKKETEEHARKEAAQEEAKKLEETKTKKLEEEAKKEADRVQKEAASKTIQTKTAPPPPRKSLADRLSEASTAKPTSKRIVVSKETFMKYV